MATDYATECENHGMDDIQCGGEVDWHRTIGGTMTVRRCWNHQEAKLDALEAINRRYPDSPVPPSDFDPFYAGERWNYDDPW